MADNRANQETEGHDRFKEWKVARFNAMLKLLIEIEEWKQDDEAKQREIVATAKGVFNEYGITRIYTVTDTSEDETSEDEDEPPRKRLNMCVP